MEITLFNSDEITQPGERTWWLITDANGTDQYVCYSKVAKKGFQIDGTMEKCFCLV